LAYLLRWLNDPPPLADLAETNILYAEERPRFSGLICLVSATGGKSLITSDEADWPFGRPHLPARASQTGLLGNRWKRR
jgi:hypothetical protein